MLIRVILAVTFLLKATFATVPFEMQATRVGPRAAGEDRPAAHEEPADRSDEMAHRWKVLAVTSIGLFMASLDLFIVNIAFPDLSRSFDDASLSSLSWVLNGYAIVFAALLVPPGRIADRVGRKRVFIIGLLTFVVASALCAISPTIPVLVAARVIQAVGAAMMIPTTLGLLLPAFPPEQRPVAIGIWSAVSGVAAALGPAIRGPPPQDNRARV